MRNLKKVLSLSLAFVMLLGMMVIGAGAVTNIDDFNDQAEITDTYREAVDLLTAIEVLEGSNGAFNPAGTLTREQAAKIVATVALGVDAAEALNTTVAPFSDVAATRWSAGYIAYCANVGIINGVGGGRFNPTGEVTGYQFAKMLLGVLGYGVNDEYVGAKWVLNVTHDARVVGLDYHVNITTAPATREEAAQLAYNALTTPLVSWSALQGTYTSYAITNGRTELLGNIASNIFRIRTVDFEDELGYGYEYWRYIDRVGAITADYSTDDIIATVTSGSVGAAYRANVWNDTFRIWENGLEIGAANSSSAGSYTFGVTADGSNDKAFTMTAAPYSYLDANNTLRSTYAFYSESLKGKTGNMVGYNGQKVELIDTDEDGAIDKVIVTTGYLAEVTKVKPESASAGRSVDVTVYVPNVNGTVSASFETENYEKGDYVMVYPADTTLTALVSATTAQGNTLKDRFGAIAASEKCEVITAAVSAYYAITNKAAAAPASGTVLDQAGSVGVSGERRNYNGVFHTGKALSAANNGAGVALGQNLAVDGYNLNNATYAFYLDNLGNVAGVKVVDDSIGNYAYITRVGHDTFGRNVIVEAILADGTIGTYTIATNSGKNYASTTSVADNGTTSDVGTTDIIANINTVGVGRIYAYSLDGSTITLTALPKVALTSATQTYGKYANPANVAGGNHITTFVKGGTTITHDGVGSVAYATDETVFIYYDGSRITRYVGKNNAPDINTTNGIASANVAIATERVGTTTYATFVVVTAAPAVSNSAYLYITRSQYFGWSTDLKGSPIYYYEAILNGAKVNVAAKQTTLSVGVHTYNFDADAFTGGDVNGYTIESGVYDCDSGDHVGANTVTGVVKVRSNNDVVVIANTAMVTGKDTGLAGSDADMVINGATMWSLVANDKVETLNLGDEVAIVFTKQGNLRVAKDVYVTKAATVAPDETQLTTILSNAKDGDNVTYYGNLTSEPTVKAGVTLYVAGNVPMTASSSNGGTIVANSVTGTTNGNVVVTQEVSGTFTVGSGSTVSVEKDVVTGANITVSSTGKTNADGTTTPGLTVSGNVAGGTLAVAGSAVVKGNVEKGATVSLTNASATIVVNGNCNEAVKATVSMALNYEGANGNVFLADNTNKPTRPDPATISTDTIITVFACQNGETLTAEIKDAANNVVHKEVWTAGSARQFWYVSQSAPTNGGHADGAVVGNFAQGTYYTLTITGSQSGTIVTGGFTGTADTSVSP